MLWRDEMTMPLSLIELVWGYARNKLRVMLLHGSVCQSK
jgi:hypothetical protein